MVLCAVLASIHSAADYVLGYLPSEPAPTIAAVLSGVDIQGEVLRAEAYADGDQLIEDLKRGRLDLAMIEEPTTPIAGVGLLAELYPSVLHMLHRDSAAPRDLAGLLTAGPVYAGAPGGAGRRLAQSLIADFGLEDVTLLDDAWTVEPEVYFIFGGLLAPDALQRLGGFELFSLGRPERLMLGSTADALMLRYPNLRGFVLPADLYPSLGAEPALTVSVSTLLVAADTLADDRAFMAIAAIEHARPAIAVAYPLARLPQDAAGSAIRTLSLHAGARRYAERDAPTFLERYAEILALAFSVVIALGSASVTVERRRRQARKDRLDVFYQRVLAARPAPGATADEAVVAAREIRSIQSEVFDLVVAERVDADASLVAFLTLSNRVLSEAESADDAGA